MSDAARRFMGLDDNPRLNVITADGRPYLELTDETYDIIVADAYHQPYIPFYLATREFFEAAREHLRPGGVIALNVAGVPGDERLSEAIGSTLLAAFPQAWRWEPLRFNELMLGFTTRSAGTARVRRGRRGRHPLARSSRALEPVDAPRGATATARP